MTILGKKHWYGETNRKEGGHAEKHTPRRACFMPSFRPRPGNRKNGKDATGLPLEPDYEVLVLAQHNTEFQACAGEITTTSLC